ncbi:hypothetical protein ACH4VR_29075 [Streptomyces sp. NPDC020883]|uniref:hypothetical protein n=1 Tax=Streptomyces sp. NPDC020883 TaxID=3365099 RepID=UPI0037ADAC28
MLTTHNTTPQTSQSHQPYQTLKAMLALGRGPHAIKTIADHAKLDRETIRQELNAMVEAGLCTRSTAMPGHFELTVPVVGTDSMWLLHALPTVDPYIRDQLRTLHQATGHVVLMHGHTLLPPVRLALDHYSGTRTDFLEQLDSHPTAAGRLRQAPLGVDAPGLVIKAHLDRSSPATSELQRIRTAGFAISEAPLPGWSLLSVPVHASPQSLGLWELTGIGVAGALSLVVPTPDLDPHLHTLLNELDRIALYLAPSDSGSCHAPYVRHAA